MKTQNMELSYGFVQVNECTIIQEKISFIISNVNIRCLNHTQHWRTGNMVFGIEERLTTTM
jgi:hypothetical protein